MPLATKLRPNDLNTFVGQSHLIGENGPIRQFIKSNSIPSMIFWGPPGSGKTTLAHIISNMIDADFISISAVSEGKSVLKKILEKAKNNKKINLNTILFIDEIHRWSKSQQDSLLPAVEQGDITLIGATTENPSFTIISALLSRTRVFIFKSHTTEDIAKSLNIAINYIKKERLNNNKESVLISQDLVELLSNQSNGDIRFALNSLEIAISLTKDNTITHEIIESAIQRSLNYDKKGDEHYNLISAVHKSLRSSNATAATYWIMRMLEAGEDPLYIARRLLRFASEDIGNANTNALLLANVVYDTCHKLGMPECNTALIQLAEYLANSKKSNKTYVAVQKANEDIKNLGNLEVPLHFRNAPTKLMKELGYGKDYEYDHDLEEKKSAQQCMPNELVDRNYFN